MFILFGVSYGVNNDLLSVGNDIFGAIRVMANNITANLKTTKDIFVLVSVDVASLLMTNALFQKLQKMKLVGQTNKRTIFGFIGMYSMYLDPYAKTDHITVGYKNRRSNMDAGLTFNLFDKLAIQQAVDPESGQLVYWLFLRYGYAFNPADTQEDDSSIYFATCDVDPSRLVDFPVYKI